MGRYLEFTKGTTSPEVFKLYSSLHAIGSAVERRVWTQTDRGLTFPNMFVFLIGPPNIGKSAAIRPITNLVLRASPSPYIVGPNDVTKQGFLDALISSGYKTVLINGRVYDYHYLGLHILEIGNFMHKYDTALMGLLTDLWDCPEFNEEVKRHGKGKNIEFPTVSLIVGAASVAFGNIIGGGGEAWDSGFMARSILVYSDHEVKSRIRFGAQETNDLLGAEIVERFKHLGQLGGEMKWSDDAQDAYAEFDEDPSQPPPPNHHLLANYNARRNRHLCKLTMISALNDGRMEVEGDDVMRALSWMMIAEHDMPKIFSNMIMHEDGRMLREVAFCVRNLYKEKGREVQHNEIYTELSKMVQVQRIAAFIDAAVEAGYIQRVAGTTGNNAEYTPGR